MGASHHLFVAALSGTAGATWTAATGDEQPDSAAYGIAFLSRYDVLGWRVVRLPGRWHASRTGSLVAAYRSGCATNPASPWWPTSRVPTAGSPW